MLSELFNGKTLRGINFDTPLNKLANKYIAYVPIIFFKVKNGVCVGNFCLLEDIASNKHIQDCAQAPHIHLCVIFDFLIRQDLWSVKICVHPTDFVVKFEALWDFTQLDHYDI